MDLQQIEKTGSTQEKLLAAILFELVLWQFDRNKPTEVEPTQLPATPTEPTQPQTEQPKRGILARMFRRT